MSERCHNRQAVDLRASYSSIKLWAWRFLMAEVSIPGKTFCTDSHCALVAGNHAVFNAQAITSEDLSSFRAFRGMAFHERVYGQRDEALTWSLAVRISRCSKA